MEEPYNHGVSYNPIPPNKPFGDISNLSGGERSIAALALLFAIQSYKPAPFFILDEIDESLDVSNVLNVSQYFKERSKNMQFIVISLNNKLYANADALIGVYRIQSQTSRILTLDLSKFNQT